MDAIVLDSNMSVLVNESPTKDFHVHKGLRHVNDQVMYSLRQFADDTMLIGEDSWENIWAIKALVRGLRWLLV